ncbi:MAG: hypothetical protein KJ808_08680 [Acidobacteria bacterium]|nr:hypothetical protein [Acidobacteriota bacterium]MBU4307195.1 hypothetical protein [Acidobacteriota bacterium]MCG2810270.1 DUF6429 family protein [Candidatus Aminicenantes bacterium]
MKLDTEKIDRVVLALLHLGLHDDFRAWKSFDWDAMDRLHKKGIISNPVGKTKSVAFSESGLRESQRLLA